MSRLPMPSYIDLVLLLLPVFAIIAIGVAVGRVRWVEGDAESSLVKLVVNLCMPALIFDTVTGNAAVRGSGNVLLPPIIGFVLTAGGILVAYWAGRAIGLAKGKGLRTFALATGIGNFGYLPLPIMGAMWGRESQGVLLVHNVGVEAAIWTVGVLVLSGFSAREAVRRLLSPMVITMVIAIALNLTGLAAAVPRPVAEIARALGACAIPLGLLMIGVSLAPHLSKPGGLLDGRIMTASCVLRLALLPVLVLAVARWLPFSVELKRVLVIQAAMPAAVFPIVLAKHYGGQPLTAVQIVLATTAVGVLTIPLWIRAGLAWVGV